jgi:hypothetical protein
MTGTTTIDVGNVEMKRDEEGQKPTLILLMAEIEDHFIVAR